MTFHKRLLFCLQALVCFVVSDPYEKSDCYQAEDEYSRADTVHGFKVDGLKRDIKYDMKDYRGKVMLLVNVASF